MASKKWKKRLKKLGKNISKVLKPAAVLAAVAIPGVGGIAAAAALGASGAALTPGNRKKKFKALKKVGVNVGAAVVAKGALGLISGQGVGASVFSSAPKIVSDVFGSGAPLAGAAKMAAGPGGLEGSFLDSPGTPGASTPGLDGGALLGSMLSGASTSETSNPAEAGERGGGPFGGFFGGETAPGEKPGINPLWIAGGVVALLVLSKKKAG